MDEKDIPKNSPNARYRKGVSSISDKAKDQVDKFREAARELETDDDEARFDERLKRIAKPPPPKNDDSKNDKPGK